MQYIITNGFGDQLGGISTNEGEIKRMAQRAANDLGKLDHREPAASSRQEEA